MYSGKVYQVSRPKTGKLRASITEINFMLTYIANEKKKKITQVFHLLCDQCQPTISVDLYLKVLAI